MQRYLVIISRDRPELLGRLATIYGQKGEVEIHFDRRQGQTCAGRGNRPDRRIAARRDAALQGRGFIVIRRHAVATASP
jgi:hypothetical protein